MDRSLAPPGIRLALRRSRAGEADFVPHLTINEVQTLSHFARLAARSRKGERDALLIMTIFDGCFRVSEALSLTPNSLIQASGGWAARITGKRKKPGEVAISASLAAMLQSYAYRFSIKPDQRLFPINSSRVWQIVDRAFERAGISKPDHVGTVHVLRHSGAIARLARTRNPKALQDHLCHKEARMTIRYLKTLSSQESLKIQQEVDFQWSA